MLLDKISELVKEHHDKLVRGEGEDWQKFYCHALVTVEFLHHEKFNKHYVSGLFEPKHLALLYQKLFIFTDFSEGVYFVPCLLQMLSNEEISKHRVSLDSVVAPLVLYFPDGPPRRGIFCALVSFLTSPENHLPGPWKLKKPARSVTPTCLHRNCIQFSVPGFIIPCSITLIDTLLHFEVHFNLKSHEDALNFCPVVKQAISAGLRKANVILGYTDSIPSFALLCPCGEGDPHHATIGDRTYICSLDEEVGEVLAQNQKLWFESKSSALEIESLAPVAIKKCRLSLLESHLPQLLSKLNNHASRWRDIGMHLGFYQGELNNIQGNVTLITNSPNSWLTEMLTQWLQWAPGDGRKSSSVASVDSLTLALNNSGLGATALEIESFFH